MQAWPCRWRVNPNWVLCCERAVVIVHSPLDGCASGRAQCSVGAMALLFEYCPVCKGEEVPDTSAVLAAVWCWSGAIPLLQGNTLIFHCCCLWEVYCWGFYARGGANLFYLTKYLGSLEQVLRLLGGTEQAHRAESKACSHCLLIWINSATLACKLHLLFKENEVVVSPFVLRVSKREFAFFCHWYYGLHCILRYFFKHKKTDSI